MKRDNRDRNTGIGYSTVTQQKGVSPLLYSEPRRQQRRTAARAEVFVGYFEIGRPGCSGCFFHARLVHFLLCPENAGPVAPSFSEESSVNGSWSIVPARSQAGKEVESSKSKENA